VGKFIPQELLRRYNQAWLLTETWLEDMWLGRIVLWSSPFLTSTNYSTQLTTSPILPISSPVTLSGSRWGLLMWTQPRKERRMRSLMFSFPVIIRLLSRSMQSLRLNIMICLVILLNMLHLRLRRRPRTSELILEGKQRKLEARKVNRVWKNRCFMVFKKSIHKLLTIENSKH